jgi:hypothetical protein
MLQAPSMGKAKLPMNLPSCWGPKSNSWLPRVYRAQSERGMTMSVGMFIAYHFTCA